MGVTVKYHRGAWWVFVNDGGKRKSKKVGDEAAARAVAKQLRARLALGAFSLTTADSPTFTSYATTWLRDRTAVTKAKTAKFYTFNLALHIQPVIGHKPVATITRADCRAVIAAGRAKGLKVASMRGVNRTLSAVLSQAVEDALLPANPAFRMGQYLRDGDAAKAEIEPWTREQAHTFLTTVQRDRPHWYPFFLCALRTGMRLGELIALEWQDLDFEARIIHVRRARVGGRVTTPKNRQRRRIDMSLTLSETLKRLRTERKRQALARGMPLADAVFVMPDRVRVTADGTKRREPGGLVDGDNLRRRVFVKLAAAAGVPVIRLHDLRHTFASLLIQNRESLAYVRDQLGHSSIQVTVDIYGHLVPGENRTAVDRLDAAPVPKQDGEQSHG